MTTLYDKIGQTYTGRRQSDPRIAASIQSAIDGCDAILNVGAGTGSYEPPCGCVIALEPSITMIAQRPAGAASAVQGRAEALPFPDRSFDAVLGVLTVHHWKDQEKGFAECARVARSRVVFLTIDIDVCARFWLFDYFPDLLRIDRRIFPSLERFRKAFGSIEVKNVPIPADCRDGFLCAYWKRPREYLDPAVRASISTFSKIQDIDSRLASLEDDIDSGIWDRQYSGILPFDEFDLGYRVVTALIS
jgi:SAM-dependent methyltransferase